VKSPSLHYTFKVIVACYIMGIPSFKTKIAVIVVRR
jgi:hypothetical protein